MRKRVKRLAGSIIIKSFPLLTGKNILFIILPFRFYAISFWIPPLAGVIIISTKAKKLSDRALSGLIAHELCHQERYRIVGIFSYIGFVLKYFFSQKVRIEEEHEVDRMTVRKGFAAELYELTLVTHESKSHKKIIDNYLTPDEIIKYAREKGLWNGNNSEMTNVQMEVD